MASATQIAKSIGALGVGLILSITLYEPIYLFIGNLLEQIQGVSRLNPQIAGLAADLLLLPPMIGGFMTVKLAPQPKRKAIPWTPIALLAISLVGVIFGDFSSIEYGRWSLGIVIGLLGALYGGFIAARASE